MTPTSRVNPVVAALRAWLRVESELPRDPRGMVNMAIDEIIHLEARILALEILNGRN